MQSSTKARVRGWFHNSGAGAQHNNLGSGNQYNNSGSGAQYNAKNIQIVNREKDNFLADLRVTDPRDDKTRIERTKGNLLKDSYKWILNHDDFRKWQAEKRLLWIKGGPGKGKTMLLCGVIDELFAMGHTSTFYFFCQATDARLSTATSVVRGLLYLILDQNPTLLNLLRDKYDKAGSEIFKDVNSWDALCKMLISAVSHKTMQNVILVVDALDECTSGLDQLIGFIIDLTAHVKVIVSSRLWLSIDRGLAVALEATKIYLSLELNEDVISAAVKAYIHHQVEYLATKKSYDNETKMAVETFLADNSNDTFLWVALVCGQLADNRLAKRHTQQKLREFPRGLDSLYKQILEQIFALPDAEICRHLLAFMSIVYRPLSLAELGSLLDDVGNSREIVEDCGSLVTIRAGTVYFIHQSVKDYLIRHENLLFPEGTGASHNLVLSKLLQAMSNTLRRNVYAIDSHGVRLEKVSVPDPDPLASVRYACVYWADHLVDEGVGPQQFDEVCLFITEHFLHWLEALSLLRSMSKGILSISRVQQMIRASTQPLDRNILMQEAVRFIRSYRIPIETDPTQVYLSALVFCPTASVIRGLFRAEEPKWPVKPAVDEDWSLCMQTLEGHEKVVNSMDFSIDQALLASASNDGTVKLWDTTTGHCVQSLESPPYAIYNVAFSADRSTLAWPPPHRIELWSTITRRPIRTLPMAHSPRLFAFSNDGALLACSNSGRLQLWDTKSGRCMHSLKAHRCPVTWLGFSEASPLLASVSLDGTFKFWQTSTGTCVKSVRQHIGSQFILSLGGIHLAFLSKDCAHVRVYSLKTSTCFDLPSDQQLGAIKTIAVSHNGNSIAIGDDSGNIHLWDLNKKQRTGILTGHRGFVTAAVFSKDGWLLASASEDRSIKLWDLTRGLPHGLLSETPFSSSTTLLNSDPASGKPHPKMLTAIKRVLPLTRDRKHKAQETEVTQFDLAHQQVKKKVHSISFACGGDCVVSVSRDQIGVWDTRTGNCIDRMNVGSLVPCAATVFKGNVHIATSSKNLIFIRDKTKGVCLRVLEVLDSAKGPTIASHDNLGSFPESTEDRELYVGEITFSVSGYKLHTNLGTVDLETMESSRKVLLEPTHPRISRLPLTGYHVESGDSWVKKDGKNYLWLPTEYRSLVMKTHGNSLAIGLDTGRVLIVRFE